MVPTRSSVQALVLAAGLLLLASAPPARAQSAAEAPAAPTSFNVIAGQVARLFPVVQTDVIEVSGDRVTLGAGREQGVVPATELIAYREGRELYHPRTKQLLGRTEETLGRLVVTEVADRYSVATLAPGAPGTPRPGDKARVAAGRVRLTVVPLVSGVRPRLVEAATDDLVRELERTGRFQVVFGDQVAVWLDERKISLEEFMRGRGVQEAHEKFKLSHLLAVHYTMAQGKPFVDLRVFSNALPQLLLAQALFVPPSIRQAPSQQFSTAPGKETSPLQRRSLLARLLSGNFEPNTYSAGASSIPLRSLAVFPFPVLSMDVAVGQDKVPRVVVTDGQRVFLYRLVGEKLEAEWTHSKLMAGAILGLQFADLDGDGVLDVVVNRQDAKLGMFSYLLTTRNGRPAVVVEDLPLILLAVDERGAGVATELWGQPPNAYTFFSPGAVTRYVLKGSDLAAAGQAHPHDSFRLTGATFATLSPKDKGPRALAFIDAQNRLVIAENGQEIWRSSASVGQGLAQARLEIMQGRTAVDKYFRMKSNPLAVDLDGDGIQEIVVPVNDEEAGRLVVVFRGPTGLRTQVVASGSEGLVTGMGAIPGADGGSPSLIMTVVKRTGLLGTSGDTQLIMTVPE
jgi:hypothetical protein